MLLWARRVGRVRIATWNMAADGAGGGRAFLASLCCEVLLLTEVHRRRSANLGSASFARARCVTGGRQCDEVKVVSSG